MHRVATLADLPRIVEIYNSTIPSRMVTADTEPVSVESRLPWFEQHRSAQRPLWVAEREGRVIAWLAFSNFYGRPAYQRTAELSVYVDAAVRGQGLGTELMREALAYAPGVGIDHLVGFVFAHNAPSLALCARLGFERWGLLPGVARLDGIDRDLVIVGKVLTPLPAARA